MKDKFKYLIFILLFFLPIFAFSQNCTNYHIDHCRWADRTFLYSRQSKSALFKKGMSSEFSIVVYGGEEYYISVDGHRKLGDIRLQIFEDDAQKTQLYDNSEFKYEKYFFFKVSRTRKLIVEVSTREPEKDKNPDEKYCVGVLIEFRDTGSPDEAEEDIGF